MENFEYSYFPIIDDRTPPEIDLCSENNCPYSYQEEDNKDGQCSLMRDPYLFETSNPIEAPFEYNKYVYVPKNADSGGINMFSYGSDGRQRTDSFDYYGSKNSDGADNFSSHDSDVKQRTDSFENCGSKNLDGADIFSSHDSDVKQRTDSFEKHRSTKSDSYNEDENPVNLNKFKTYDIVDIFSSSNSDGGSSERRGINFGTYITNEKESIQDWPSESLKSDDVDYEESVNFLTFFPPGDHSIHRAQRIKKPKPFTFTTPLKSWKRVFEKYSPSTEVLHSPVKHIEANILPNVTLDDQVLGLLWVCSMSEQFYYDNSIILLQKYFSDPLQLKIILMMNSRDMDPDYFLKNMIDVNVLGSGSYGDVYRVKRKGTEDYFAVKYLKKMPAHSFVDHADSLMSYLKEKNFLLQARNSPYVVQFVTSLKFPKINGLFLFFEWCLCDLRKYINLVNWNYRFTIITDGIYNGSNEGIAQVFSRVFSQFEDDLYTVSMVYIFEVFCAIAFLGDCNLVHQDLKPENIMISTNLHLKIGDFGLAYNTKFITRRSQLHFIKASVINLTESSNYGPVWGGTPTYEDMELCYREVRRSNPQALQLIDKDKNNFKIKLIETLEDANPNFLSDLWSCGIMALELLLGGLHFLRFGYFSEEVIKQLKLTGIFQIDLLRLTYNKNNNRRYIAEGLRKFCGESFEDLTDFISSIFLPRLIRSENYTKEKELYRYKNKVKLSCIDINKIEHIQAFAKYGLHYHNAFLFNMPPGLKTLLSKPLQPKYNNLRHLLQNIMNDGDLNFYNIAPGIQGMFF